MRNESFFSAPQLKRDSSGGPNTYAIMRGIVCVIIGAFLACHTRPSSDLPPAPATKSCGGLASPDSAVYEEMRVDVKPAIRVSPLLVYPQEARAMGVKGRVVVSAIIGFDGKTEPSSLQVVHRVDPDLDREAVRYVRAAAFSPACVAGRAVRVHVSIPVEFRLGGR